MPSPPNLQESRNSQVASQVRRPHPCERPPPRMDVAEAKRALRAQVRARLLALPPAQRALEEELVTAAVQDAPEWRAAGTVLLYRNVPPEFSTVGLANAAWRTGKRVLFPRI